MMQKKLNVLNAIFFTTSGLVAVVGGGIYLWLYGISWIAVALFFVMLTLTLMSISAGYHRLYSHRTHEASTWLKLSYLLFGAAAFEESCLRWASDHRMHHRFVDTDKDPYNIKAGALWAHIGWIIYDAPAERPLAKDLQEDRLVSWQDRHWIPIATLVGFILPAAIGACFGDMWGGLMFGGIVRMFVGHHFTFMINSLAHMIGTQPYSDQNTARDSWITAIFTFGEGYHNFHHWKPGDYRNGVRLYHWDPPKWFIQAMSWLGQSWGLIRTPEDEILRARIVMDRRRLPEAQVARTGVLQTHFEKVIREIEDFSRRRREWAAALQHASDSSPKPEVSTLHEKFVEARRRCRQSYKDWYSLLQEFKQSRSSSSVAA